MKLTAIILIAALFSGCGSAATPGSSVDDSAPAGSLVSSSAAGEISVNLGFAGDICFDDSEQVMQRFHAQGDDIKKCIDPEYIKLMNNMDVMWINNEFCYSDRGKPMPGKAWTFRSDPGNVSILKELGVDIAGLANNHVFDYGEDAFADTLSTLRNAGIPYVGAGMNIKEAASPVYMEVGGIKIAYVAASRAEKHILTPEAKEDSPGVLRCYDTGRFVAAIKEARANADYVIALPHWGTERSTVLEPAQTGSAREYIDAGADIIIGAHSHCLQGMEFYKGKPVIYSLGNFWFDEFPEDTEMIQVTLTGTSPDNLNTKVTVHPGTQKDLVTKMADTSTERDRVFKYLEKISVNVKIKSDGTVE